ncbi:MAG: FHA domain-containing protein [Blastocatellia bacterium]|nr:FHA domain-containing protein [Blastocatellia bacterium]
MKNSEIADIVERSVDFLERTGADKLAQHYLSFAMASFARGSEEQLANYMLRYDVQPQKPLLELAHLVVAAEVGSVRFKLDPYSNLVGRIDPETRSYPNIDLTDFDFNAKISRRHARLYSMDGRNFWIEDLGSFNGTSLNGVRITPRQPHPLHDGDIIIFGTTEVTFICLEELATAE